MSKPCELRLIGEVDRIISEMKYVLDHADEYDTATFQTVKHHVEDMELFCLYARGRLIAIKSMPSLKIQGPRGY